MSEIPRQPSPADIPAGIAGMKLYDPTEYELTATAIARARLQQVTLDLLSQHDLPDELELEFTRNGASTPSRETFCFFPTRQHC